MSPIEEFLTTREAAQILGVAEWQIRRLFELGDLPEPTKFGGKRVILRESLPKIVLALQAHDWFPTAEGAAR